MHIVLHEGQKLHGFIQSNVKYMQVLLCQIKVDLNLIRTWVLYFLTLITLINMYCDIIYR